jgi:dimeric dUTPase (all-alpha-NTP-PPase superfamily)
MKLIQSDLEKELALTDKLETLFYLQKQLQIRLGYNFIEFNNEYFNLMFIGAITELCEMIEKTKWKPWKKSSKNDIKEIQKELIDVWHFIINLSIACNLEPDTLIKKFIEKNKENNKRQDNGY